MTRPLVSIGIVTFNSRQYLPVCLESIFQQTYHPVEILVWDNNSQDQTVEWLEQTDYPFHHIVSEYNYGFGGAHNQLIKRSSGSYYLALNPDVILEITFIERLVDILEQDDHYGWVCGKMFLMTLEGAKTTEVYSVGHALRRSGYAFNLTETEDIEIFGANAASVLYRRAMLEDICNNSTFYFDETFFLYYEDVDLDWRARLLGWRCACVKEAIAYHVGDASHGRSSSAVIIQAQVNRIVSIIKNAYLIDLIFYNIPRIIMRLSLGLLIDRKQTFSIIKMVISRFKHTLYQRKSMSKRRRYRYTEMNNWFKQANQKDQSTSFRRIWKKFMLF